MTTSIDEAINKNLNVIYNGRNHSAEIHRLFNLKGQKCNKSDGIRMAEYLEKENLAYLKVESCYISNFGLEVSESGGWIKYKKAELEKENKLSIQQQRINDLQEENYKLQNKDLKQKIFWAIFGYVAGLISWLVTFFF